MEVATKALSNLSPMRDLHYDNPKRGKRSLCPQFASSQEVVSMPSGVEISFFPPNSEAYTPRARGEREPALFFVLSGGEKRERDYFRQLERQEITSLKLLFVSPQGQRSGQNSQSHLGSSPRDMKTYWRNAYDVKTHEVTVNDESFQVKGIDRVFFLTDLDNFRFELQELLAEEGDVPYRWIISNPCFEMWLYYSYCEEDPEEKLSTLSSLNEVKRPKHLKGLCSQLLLGGMDPRKAFKLINNALSRAKQYDKGIDEDGIPCLFTTQMVEVAEQICKYIAPKKTGTNDFKEGLPQRTKV